MKLIKVNKHHHNFLYEMLKERNDTINISHRKMPEYNTHVNFVESNPYKGWYIIEINGSWIGNIYITNMSEIGIFILEKYQGLGYAKQAVQLIMKKHKADRYLANINPKNKKSIRMFHEMGFLLLQHTYELRGFNAHGKVKPLKRTTKKVADKVMLRIPGNEPIRVNQP